METQHHEQLNRWLLVTVSTAGAPDSVRVYVWRRLRQLGAVYLQQSVCMLPDRADPRKEVNRLADRVRREGGTAQVFGIHLTDEAQQRHLIASFNQARDDEYREVVERVPSFLQELATERQRGRTTYAEVEESEADLERFHVWLAKIAKRDYFRASLGQEARQGVERCAQALADFEAAAFAADNMDNPEKTVETENAESAAGAVTSPQNDPREAKQ